MNLKITSLSVLAATTKHRVDDFILNEMSTGEFINTAKFLAYHPKDRFIDDSIIITDEHTGEIKCVMMAGSFADNREKLISHPGTTFAGPIFHAKQGIEEIEQLLDILLVYYEKKYSQLEWKLQPSAYASQPIEDVLYLLLRKGFGFHFTALANVINISRIVTEEEIFKLYDSRKRNQVRKIIRDSHYTFKQQGSFEESIWRNMNDNLKARHAALATHNYDEITQLMNWFPENIVPYIVFKNDEEYAAFALVFKFKNVFHTQYLDMNYDLRRDHPNAYMNHELIKTAISEGFTLFSFGASTEQGGEYLNQGLYRFKKQFGDGRILLPLLVKEVQH